MAKWSVHASIVYWYRPTSVGPEVARPSGRCRRGPWGPPATCEVAGPAVADDGLELGRAVPEDVGRRPSTRSPTIALAR